MRPNWSTMLLTKSATGIPKAILGPKRGLKWAKLQFSNIAPELPGVLKYGLGVLCSTSGPF